MFYWAQPVEPLDLNGVNAGNPAVDIWSIGQRKLIVIPPLIIAALPSTWHCPKFNGILNFGSFTLSSSPPGTRVSKQSAFEANVCLMTIYGDRPKSLG